LSSPTAPRLPRITILMPCRNGERFIAAAIASVRRQSYPDLEHIVLDACSTDGTLSLLRSYPDVRVISEPDGSAHEAMNKGLARASGEVIGFLAVDDLYPDGTLADVGRLFTEREDLDVVAGHTLVFEESGAERRFLFEYPRPRDLRLPELMFGVAGFYGVFFRRRVFDRVGRFDETFEFTADLHYLLRVVLAGLKTARLDRPSILYRMHEGSRTIDPGRTNRLKILREHLRMGLQLAHAPDGAQARRQLLAWHALTGAKLAGLGLSEGRIRDCVCVTRELFRHNPLWPLRLVHGLALHRSVRRLALPQGPEAQAHR
jgi:glycosyltransferase involved in cell wall biosynthesis